MNPTSFNKILFKFGMVMLMVMICAANAMAYDIRGAWVGSAQGSIFGAKGSVNITSQKGEEIAGIIEGGNVFGSAKFEIQGKIRGNYIFGSRDGNSFEGYIYPDWSIRGVFKGIDGDTYQVVLRRPYYYWGMPQQGWPHN
ncbi:MAG: hypothetical protein M1511_00380 [Deltaproteobacteria bacterium]|nr:hypothetical protein [Deltaproteobacteria bacterium]